MAGTLGPRTRWEQMQADAAAGFDRVKNRVRRGARTFKNWAGFNFDHYRGAAGDGARTTGDRVKSVGRGLKKVGGGLLAGLFATGRFLKRTKSGLDNVRRNRTKGSYTFMILLSVAFLLYDIIANQFGTGVVYPQLWYGLCLGFLVIAAFNASMNGDGIGSIVTLVIICLFYIFFPSVQNNWANIMVRFFGGASGNLGVSIAYIFSMRAMMPFWLLYYLKKRDTEKSLILFNLYILFLVLLLVFSGIVGLYSSRMPYVTPTQISPTRLRSGFVEGWQDFWANFRAAGNGTSRWWSDSVNYATGGQYEGEVEDYENEPLGVSIEKVFAASSGFYEKTPVAVWGQLWGRTLDKPIGIKLSCYTGIGKNRINGSILPEEAVKKFNITTEDIKDFECVFKEGLEPGYHQVFVKAEYNFVTMSYLKGYFMELSRLRSLNRQDIDPFNYFQISDRIPTAKYTNGPIKVGMETTQPLMGVSTKAEENIFTPAIGISIDGGWLGKLEKINSLVLSTPDTISVKDCYPNFKGGTPEAGRNVYELNNSITEHLDYGRTFRCLMDFSNPAELLDNSPFKVEYFRATVDYVFSTEEFTSVNIFPLPELEGVEAGDLGPYNVVDDMTPGAPGTRVDYSSFNQIDEVNFILNGETLDKSFNKEQGRYEFVQANGEGFSITTENRQFVAKTLGLDILLFAKDSLSELLTSLVEGYANTDDVLEVFHNSEMIAS